MTMILMGLVFMVANYTDSLTGILVGVSLGVLGSAIGVFTALRQTQSSASRSFFIRGSVLTAALALSFFVIFLLIPGWYRFLLFIPYGIVLFLLIRGSRNQPMGSHARMDTRS
jgi:hypothetical protein